ncbi:uncharacterized protein LOC142785265 [Rhipicephalus microplus]|uniref:uncharacterized protein LOC142785265 n=1 Tax=Rhipicephalus microplus TaxID=6941 RepID=UPI003F6A8F16
MQNLPTRRTLGHAFWPQLKSGMSACKASEALVLFPFLASEASLLLEFEILYKKNVVDEFTQGCQKLCDLALRNGDDIEVAKFSEAAGDNPILAALEFAAARCNEALDVILLEKDIPITPCLLREADGGLSLYIDRERILRASSLLKA